MTSISPRERAVFQAIARGLTTEEVATELYLSPHTVRTYVKTGMRKLGSRTRAHSVAVAIERGLISSGGPYMTLSQGSQQAVLEQRWTAGGARARSFWQHRAELVSPM
jgi:DNA-binding CsgD family transcriptional regulator